VTDLTSRLAQLSPEQRARLAERVAASRPQVPPDKPSRSWAWDAAFWGANSPAALWDLLVRGVDAVTPIPLDRWNGDAFFDADPDAPGKIATREGAFIDGIAEFDASYFGISPVEARQMDPQQRLFLEVAIEALESAGLTRAQLAGSMCGVFVGVHSHSSEYYGLQSSTLEGIDTYTSTGTAQCARQPAVVLSRSARPEHGHRHGVLSSLVAFHQACLSLRGQHGGIVGGPDPDALSH
jgi:acyl transferase domain-containing protein